MMKKQLIYLLTALLMTCFTSTAWAWSGSGTSADPYLIANETDWNTLASNSSSNTYSGTYFKLTADISVTTMVGTDGSRFAGIFDGNGHTLTSPTEILAAVLSSACPIPADSAAWRAQARTAPDEAALRSRFDTFRRTYTARREFAAHRLLLSDCSPDLLDLLAALGFQIRA